jgi:hypothetical protein
MKVAFHPVSVSARSELDFAWRVFNGFLLVLMVIAGGARALFTWMFEKEQHARMRSRSWLAEARCQASIATSYAHMAKTMLQSSRRENRQERQSRL